MKTAPIRRIPSLGGKTTAGSLAAQSPPACGGRGPNAWGHTVVGLGRSVGASPGILETGRIAQVQVASDQVGRRERTAMMRLSAVGTRPGRQNGGGAGERRAPMRMSRLMTRKACRREMKGSIVAARGRGGRTPSLWKASLLMLQGPVLSWLCWALGHRRRRWGAGCVRW